MGELIDRALDAVSAGHSTTDVIAGMMDTVEDCRTELKTIATPLDARSTQQVAATAAMDADLGTAITRAIERAGRHGIVTVEPTVAEAPITISATEGMWLDRGFLRPEFATDPGGQTTTLDDCLILLYDGRISDHREIVPILEKVAASGKPLLILAHDVDDNALATVVLNHQRGVLRCVAVRAVGLDNRRLETMRDVGAYTGATVIDRALGMALSFATLDDLGTARRVIVSEDQTSIIGGAGTEEQIATRAGQLETLIESTVDDFTREKLQERLARLRASLVTIAVGGTASVERHDRRQRTLAGLHAAASGIRSGVVNGGGTTLLRLAAKALSNREANAARELGREAVATTLEQPLRVLAQSAGLDETVAVERTLKGKPKDIGLNLITGAFEDFSTSGILDPVSTLDRALGIASASAKAFLETETWQLPTQPEGLI